MANKPSFGKMYVSDYDNPDLVFNIVSDSDYDSSYIPTYEQAIAEAQKQFEQSEYNIKEIRIYKLVAIVRPEPKVIEIEN